MNATEHSRLLYLIDALQGAPSKSRELLDLAEKPGASEAYRNALKQLREASAYPDTLLAESLKLRQMIR